ncbi:hypothetical protein B0H10DRAFT_1026417 [Mycena sp. CBHHK59/15]|nr:hypothetical protein B0H10DRAFT_1026417 [Mycena sp. CBHHK59/15]
MGTDETALEVTITRREKQEQTPPWLLPLKAPNFRPQHGQSLVRYARICNQQAAVMRLNPDEQFVEYEKERQAQVRAKFALTLWQSGHMRTNSQLSQRSVISSQRTASTRGLGSATQPPPA